MPLYIIFALLNAATFLLFGYDKWQAQRGGWRISEKQLLGISAIGGALGGYLAMQQFRHKTRKQVFTLLMPVFIAAHLALAAWLGFGGELPEQLSALF